jgi:prevent-host-death family protein
MCYMATTASPTTVRKRPAKAPGRPTAKGARHRDVAPSAAKVAAEAARAQAAATGRPVTVGVRELRQNLSVYLEQVKQGVAMQVTEHGRVVAVLTPVPATASRYDILLAQGLITPATRSIRDLPPPRPMPPGARPLSEILDELREERL